jgi:glycosyltransferase involved in cell wall biosynthesis
LFPISKIDYYDSNILQYQKPIENSHQWKKNKKSLKLWHLHGLDTAPISSFYTGFTIFELEEFTKKEISVLENLNKIIVPSQWAAGVIKNSCSNNNIHVQNLGVDTSIFKLEKNSINENYTFLHVGKLESRKSTWDIVNCFYNVFKDKKNVSLALMIDNFFIPDLVKEFKSKTKAKLGDKVMFIEGNKRPELLNQVYNACDCYISLSKTEGWNMPLLEAKACGLPIISTNCTAQSEFLEKNDNIVPIIGRETAHDGIFFHGKGTWNVPDLAIFENMLEDVYNKRPAKQVNVEHISKFDWENVFSMDVLFNE